MYFYKYQATGNDFVIIDDRDELFDISNQALISRLCNRRFGIGADGLILIRSRHGYDFKMIYFNADGNEGSMCGNGGRSAAAFASNLFPEKFSLDFLAYDGKHAAEIKHISPQTSMVKLKLCDVMKPQKLNGDFILDTGSPHYIKFVENLSETDVIRTGREIRNFDQFKPKGINVNFVKADTSSIQVRTYERGVEDETLSCGTGVTASAIASYFSGKITVNPVDVNTPGGKLIVSFKEEADLFSEVWLEGEASKVFEGEIDL